MITPFLSRQGTSPHSTVALFGVTANCPIETGAPLGAVESHLPTDNMLRNYRKCQLPVSVVVASTVLPKPVPAELDAFTVMVYILPPSSPVIS